MATPPKRPLRIYADTSVFGGCFDPDFRVESLRFFEEVRKGRVILLVSRVVANELRDAPPRVRGILESLSKEAMHEVEVGRAVTELRNAYLAAGVVSPRSHDDAAHVAAATVACANSIVSWNFRHILRADRIRGYNQVNRRFGYGAIAILSPKDVRTDVER